MRPDELMTLLKIWVGYCLCPVCTYSTLDYSARRHGALRTRACEGGSSAARVKTRRVKTQRVLRRATRRAATRMEPGGAVAIGVSLLATPLAVLVMDRICRRNYVHREPPRQPRQSGARAQSVELTVMMADNHTTSGPPSMRPGPSSPTFLRGQASLREFSAQSSPRLGSPRPVFLHEQSDSESERSDRLEDRPPARMPEGMSRSMLPPLPRGASSRSTLPPLQVARSFACEGAPDAKGALVSDCV